MAPAWDRLPLGEQPPWSRKLPLGCRTLADTPRSPGLTSQASLHPQTTSLLPPAGLTWLPPPLSWWGPATQEAQPPVSLSGKRSVRRGCAGIRGEPHLSWGPARIFAPTEDVSAAGCPLASPAPWFSRCWPPCGSRPPASAPQHSVGQWVSGSSVRHCLGGWVKPRVLLPSSLHEV